MQWLSANYGLVASALLIVSEGLALVFPATSGFGGVIAGVIKGLKSFGVKDSK